MELSIVIPSYQRADLLHYGLKSLAKQKMISDFEVIVLNDGIQDDTEKVCEAYKEKLDIRYVFTGHRNIPNPVWRIPGFAINIGAQLACGKYMIIMCPEMYLLDDCLQDMIDTLKNRPRALVITDGRDDQDGKFLTQVQAGVEDRFLDPFYEPMPALNTEFPFFFGVATKEFIDIGGYDEDFIGNCWDDQDIIMRLKQNGNSYVKLDKRIVHLYHSRLRYEKDQIKKLWNYNKAVYDQKFGTVKRNVEKVWGSLTDSIQARKPNALEQYFTTIYEKNIWNGKESRSGTGSDINATAVMRPQLIDLVNSLTVNSMFDIPCGDFNWMKEVVGKLNITSYIGADIIRPMIKDNEKNYASTCGEISPKFVYMNAIEDIPPKTDLIFCRDGLVHFSYNTIMKVLKNFLASGSTFLLTTHFTDTERNYQDIEDGRWHPLNFTLPPFNFPPPFKVIVEGCTECDGIYPDKALALWRLSDLRAYLEPTPNKCPPKIPGQPEREVKKESLQPIITTATDQSVTRSVYQPKKNPKLKVAHIHPWWDSAGVGIIHAEMMNKYTDIDVRHIVAGVTCLNHNTDLILNRDDQEIKQVLREADILHFNTFWYDDPQIECKFPYWDFIAGKKLIFHMHGGSICFDHKKLEAISKVATMVTCSPLIPKFMPFTTWVPNIIPIDEPLYRPKIRDQIGPFKYLFMVNHDHNKGRSEIEWLFHKLNNIYGYTILFESWLHRYPYIEGLKQRANYDIVIDNITQGFIGMVGWETLSQGQVCLARLSPEVLEAYTGLGQGNPPPIVNVSGIDELAKEIIDLSTDRKRVEKIKQEGRIWIEKFYNPKYLCRLWEERYFKIAKGEK